MNLDANNDEVLNNRYATILDFLRILFKWKSTIITFFSAVVIITLIITLLSPDIYESEASLLIKAGRENTLLDPTTAIGQITTVRRDFTNEINSEIQILKSRDLASETVTNIGADAFEDHQNVFAKTYTDLKTQTIGAIQKAIAAAAVFLGRERSTEQTANPHDVKKEKIVNAVMGNFSCEAVSESNIIVLKYENENPEMARTVLRELIVNYLEKHMSVHRTNGSYNFFKHQTETLEDKLEKTANELKNLKNETGISALEKQRVLLLERIENLQSALTNVRSELAGKDKKVVLLDESLKNVPKTMVQEKRTGSASSALEELRKQIYLLKLEEQELLSKFSEQSVPVTEIRRRLKSAQGFLEDAEVYQEVTSGVNETYKRIELDVMLEKADLISLEETGKELERQMNVAKKDLKKLHDFEIKISSLERSYEIDEANYKKYFEGKEQARIDSELESGKLSNVAISQECTLPIEPVRPNRGMNVVFGLFLGLFGSLGIALFREYFSHTFVTPDDIEKRLGIPALGTLPVIKSSQLKNKRLYIQGQFYLPDEKNDDAPEVNDSMKPMLIEKVENGETTDNVPVNDGKDNEGGKIIAITSSRPGEGVSTFSVYFASMLRNMLEKKVLLVDTNFERPEIHKMLGGELTPGLWDMVVKKDYISSFQKDNVHGFDYMPAGKITNVSLVGQGRHRIKRILNVIKRRYDYIVLDTSPIWNGGGARVSEYEALADGVILVVEAEKVRWEAAIRSKERLENTNAKIMGAILNKRRFHIPDWLYNKL